MSTSEEVKVDWTWDDDMPLAQAVRVGDTIYLSGQVALDHKGRVIGENDIEAQSRQIFENTKVILASAGAKLTDVVRLTTYFAVDLTEGTRNAYWNVRKEYFGTHRLASTGMQVKALMYPSLMLEVDVIAVARRTR